MTKKALYSVLLLAALIVGFASGYLRGNRKAVSTRQPLYYVDLMHPAYRSSKPGTAPDCGMELTPVYAEDLGSGLASARETGIGAHIAPAVQQRYGIQVTKVRSTSGRDVIRVFGRVAERSVREPPSSALTMVSPHGR